MWGQRSQQRWSCPVSAGDSGALSMQGRIPGICGALRMRDRILALLGLALALASLLPTAGARRSQDLHCGGAGGHGGPNGMGQDRGTRWVGCEIGEKEGKDRTGEQDEMGRQG